MSKEIVVRTPPGATKLPDAKGWVNRFEIPSESSDRVYVVAQRDPYGGTATAGQWACSCPGWKRHRYCKHLRVLGLLTHDPKREIK